MLRRSADRLKACAFPEATPLYAFFVWNEARRATDRRYRILCRLHRLLGCVGDDEARAYLAGQRSAERSAEGGISPAGRAAQRVIDALRAAVGAADTALHAAVFGAFEDLAKYVDLDDLAGSRPPRAARRPARPRRILIVKLGALGDIIQALAMVPAIRQHHGGDWLSLLTTYRYAEFARRTRLFDEILIDHRPAWTNVPGWLALRRVLRHADFDRVYDLQTSDRSNFYFRMLWPGPRPQWSGTAWRCTHPHANLERDRQHTMDRQAEQLLMAGIHPVARIPVLPRVGTAPRHLAARRCALLIPGSSPRHREKRWPARHFGELARRLGDAGYLPVIVGVSGEEPVSRIICEMYPDAVDLVGRTDVAALAALAQTAVLSVGNDTGATHVAAAGGHPVVAMFSRASNPSLCAPRGAIVRVLRAPDLADLAVDTVFTAALALIAEARSSAAAP